jgi:hypothetical protein
VLVVVGCTSEKQTPALGGGGLDVSALSKSCCRGNPKRKPTTQKEKTKTHAIYDKQTGYRTKIAAETKPSSPRRPKRSLWSLSI